MRTNIPLEQRWCLLNAHCKHVPTACHIFQCQTCADYQAGDTKYGKPAYPMPAIPYNILIEDRYVAIGVHETTWNGYNVVRYIPKSNYPVPAIRYRAYIFDWCVLICPRHDGEGLCRVYPD